MLLRTTVIGALLFMTPVLASLSERTVEEPAELSVRSDMDEDAILFSRDLEEQSELERRLFTKLFAKIAFKGAMKLGGMIAHKYGHHKRDFEPEEELFERDLEMEEDLLERAFEEEDLLERDYEDLDELD